jgi:hypothetical protein
MTRADKPSTSINVRKCMQLVEKYMYTPSNSRAITDAPQVLISSQELACMVHPYCTYYLPFYASTLFSAYTAAEPQTAKDRAEVSPVVLPWYDMTLDRPNILCFSREWRSSTAVR